MGTESILRNSDVDSIKDRILLVDIFVYLLFNWGIIRL